MYATLSKTPEAEKNDRGYEQAIGRVKGGVEPGSLVAGHTATVRAGPPGLPPGRGADPPVADFRASSEPPPGWEPTVMTLAQAIDLAVKSHRAGDLQQAEQLYRQILQVDPQHVDALHLLGLVAHQRGRNDVAIDLISQALRIEPTLAAAHYNLGIVLRTHGRREEALASFQRAVQLKPDYAEAHNDLGVTLSAGRPEEALASYQRAIQL